MSQLPANLGPYRILRPLGRGGMGIVFRGVHEADGHEAAIKTVRVPRPEMSQSLRREIHALARLHHSGVVRILDEGVQEGVPWYAMELIEGATLRRHCARLAVDATGKRDPLPDDEPSWWTHSLGIPGEPLAMHESTQTDPFVVEPDVVDTLEARPTSQVRKPVAAGGALRAVLTLVRQICSALAFIHGEGIVHRDLKPANLLVRRDGRPVLVDFGLWTRFRAELSREELETFGATGGTLAYMSPEQGRGELVDARADLYSLGCVLYELVTGLCPFQDTQPVRLLRMHFEAAPVPPSELVDGVLPELDELILRLLAKRPQDRPGHASAVASVLAELGAEESRDAGDPQPRAYLYRSGFAGRDDALAQVRPCLEQLQEGSGGLVLIGGESGIGKTRLLLELAWLSRRSPAHVLAGGGATAAAPLQALRGPLHSIASRCQELGPEETERLLGRRGSVLALYEPALATLPGQEAYGEAPELPAEAARLRLFLDLAETFAALARDRSVLLLIDDLHWADELTLGWLEFLLRSGQLQHEPVLVLGVYRTEEVTAPLRKLLTALAESGQAAHQLGGLDERAVGLMAEEMLALSPIPHSLVGFLARSSEGNPFFVAETLRTALAEGLLTRDALGRWALARGGSIESLPLSGSIRDLIGRRLGGLSKNARELVEVASVLGRETLELVLADAAGMGRLTAEEAITELLSRQVLETATEGRLRFVHDKIREVAYANLSEPRRVALHRVAAESLEPREDADPGTIGFHWEQAGNFADASRCYLAGAEKAHARYAHAEAERLYRAFLRLVAPPTATSVNARRMLGHCIADERAADGIAEVALAVEEARLHGFRAMEGRCLHTLAALHRAIGRMEEARALHDRSLEVARELGNLEQEGMTLHGLGLVCLDEGLLDSAEVLFQRALKIQRELGSRKEEGGTLCNLGTLRYEQGRLEEAAGLFGDALRIAREIGDRRSEGLSLGNLAEAHAGLDRPEQAFAFGSQALEIHREVGNRPGEALALTNLAALRAAQGFVEEALALFERALPIHRAAAARLGEGISLTYQAMLERRTGAIEDAERLSAAAERTLREIGNRVYLGACLCERGHLALAGGRPATECLEEARQIAREVRAEPLSELGKAIGRLENALQAIASGQPLFHGQCVEDLPAGLRRPGP